MSQRSNTTIEILPFTEYPTPFQSAIFLPIEFGRVLFTPIFFYILLITYFNIMVKTDQF